jgi:hypothetical protein
MSLLAKPADELVLEKIAGMVGGECEAHGRLLAPQQRPRHRLMQGMLATLASAESVIKLH